MPARRPGAPVAPLVVERFVKQLLITHKAVKLYPRASNIPRENAAEALAILRTHFQRQPEMRLVVTKEGLIYDLATVFPDNTVYKSFAREFYNRKLSEIRFHSGVRDVEITAFLSLLLIAPEELSASGGFEARLWDLQVDNITVKETGTKIVDAGELPAERKAGEEWPPPPRRIDDILAGAYGARPRDQRLLVRVIQDPSVVTAYLTESLTGRGVKFDEAGTAAKVAAMAHLVSEELPTDQAALYRSLLDGVLGLGEPERGRLLREKLLPEARNDEALAQLLRSGSLDELCDALVQGFASGNASRDGIARAIRNLSLIGMAERGQVLSSMTQALGAHGAGTEMISAVLADVAPTTLRVRERPVNAGEKPVETILKLVDLAPAGTRGLEGEAALERLAEEAREGITDGHVLGALVNIVAIENRPEQFATVMALIENGLELLLERGDFDIAAEVAAALTSAEEDPELEEARRVRVRNAIEMLAKPKQMRLVNAAMRLYRHDTPEHEACVRLLSILGRHAVGPLLEVLADEPDMAARKALVDLVSNMAGSFVDELGERVSDPRWFFVRNVVSILANVRDDSRVLPYLGRTLRYPDARVRRETIRAISSVRDRLAHEMLIAALDDDDAQNVQLAARYLGSLKARGGLEALMQVARGEGSGNRDVAARIEAIESLGRMGSPEVVPTLEAILRQRAILGRAQARELKTAAEAALRSINGGGVNRS